MESIGLRELRQNASDLVKRAEDGETLLVTVSGRPAAVLGPPAPTQWRAFSEIAAIFAGPPDPTWATDRDRVDRDPRPGAGMNRAVLDTSVLIAADVPRLDGELAVSAASMAELHFGALVTDDAEVRAERLRRLTLIEHLYTPLPVDGAVARSYGHLAATIARGARQPRARAMDLLIAATAHAHDAALITRNADDLRGLDALIEIVSI